jgi:hypothetical protein
MIVTLLWSPLQEWIDEVIDNKLKTKMSTRPRERREDVAGFLLGVHIERNEQKQHHQAYSIWSS